MTYPSSSSSTRSGGRWPIVVAAASVLLTGLSLLGGSWALLFYSMLTVPFSTCFALGWYHDLDRAIFLLLSAVVIAGAIGASFTMGPAGLVTVGAGGVALLLVPALAGAQLRRWLAPPGSA